MELKLKIVANDFRKVFRGTDYLFKAKDGIYHAVLCPSSPTSPNYLIYEICFEVNDGPITNIIRRSSLGSLIPSLVHQTSLEEDKFLLDELESILKKGDYQPVVYV